MGHFQIIKLTGKEFKNNDNPGVVNFNKDVDDNGGNIVSLSHPAF